MYDLLMKDCKNEDEILILHNKMVNILTESKFFILEISRGQC